MSRKNKRSAAAAAERAAAAASRECEKLQAPKDYFAPSVEATKISATAQRTGTSSCVTHGEGGAGAIWSRPGPASATGDRDDPVAECTCTVEERPRLLVFINLAQRGDAHAAFRNAWVPAEPAAEAEAAAPLSPARPALERPEHATELSPPALDEAEACALAAVAAARGKDEENQMTTASGARPRV